MQYPNIKAEMARNSISAASMAMELGVSPQTFSSWMTGKTEPTIKSAIKIAEILGCDVIYLFKTA